MKHLAKLYATARASTARQLDSSTARQLVQLLESARQNSTARLDASTLRPTTARRTRRPAGYLSVRSQPPSLDRLDIIACILDYSSGKLGSFLFIARHRNSTGFLWCFVTKGPGALSGASSELCRGKHFNLVPDRARARPSSQPPDLQASLGGPLPAFG